MESKTIPVHVGFIMDGNGRWAKAHLVPQLEGHRRGYLKVKDIARWCRLRGIKVVTVYAFSTENWGRPAAEVSYLMDLFRLAWGVICRSCSGKACVCASSGAGAPICRQTWFP